MSIEIQTKLQRIQRLSVILRAACTVLIGFVLLVLLVATVALFAGRASSINYSDHSFPIEGQGLYARLLLMTAGAATAGVIFKSLYHLRRLLGNYSRREIFTGDSATQVRQLGISCMLWGGINVVWSFMPMALSAQPPQSFTVNFDSIVIGAVVIIISWFTEMAVALKEENDLTI